MRPKSGLLIIGLLAAAALTVAGGAVDQSKDPFTPAQRRYWAFQKVVKRPVYDAARNIKPADLVYLSISLDHRVVDGAIGAAFGNAIIKQLQSPAVMLVEAEHRSPAGRG